MCSRWFFCLLLSFLIFTGYGQSYSQPKYQMAVFLPLYLDSAFDGSGNYRFENNFPKYLNPGLDFYEGLQQAVDSLNKAGVSFDITVYDTRSKSKSLSEILDDTAFSKTQIILGYVTVPELRLLAGAAKLLQIPFINVNFPNDGGITANPSFTILNSTLLSHCEAIYKFMQRNWAGSDIYYLRRASQDDDRLRGYFSQIEKSIGSVPLRIKYLTVDNNQDLNKLVVSLDSFNKSVIVVGSLDENFGRLVCARLDPLVKSYPMKIFGMPTWDALNDFNSPAYTDLELYYSTPFYYNPADSLVISIQQKYRSRFYSRPSDMVYRGYETTLHFGQLLVLHKGNLDGSIGERKYKVFNDFDIQPILTTQDNPGHAEKTITLQYLENKKLYYIKKVNGNVVAVY